MLFSRFRSKDAGKFKLGNFTGVDVNRTGFLGKLHVSLLKGRLHVLQCVKRYEVLCIK